MNRQRSVTPMVGRSRLPLHRHATEGHLCADQAGQIRHTVGEYRRTCGQCGRTFVAVVTEAAVATERCGRRTLIVHWHEAETSSDEGVRSRVAPAAPMRQAANPRKDHHHVP